MATGASPHQRGGVPCPRAVRADQLLIAACVREGSDAARAPGKVITVPALNGRPCFLPCRIVLAGLTNAPRSECGNKKARDVEGALIGSSAQCVKENSRELGKGRSI